MEFVRNDKNAAKADAQKKLSFFECFEAIVKDFSPRSQNVMRKRFGVTQDGKAKTLEEIGGEYNITRERVRQIIRSIFKDIQPKKSQPLFCLVFKHIEDVLRSNGGVLKEAALLEMLGDGNAQERGAISFFISSMEPSVQLIKENDSMHQSVAVTEFSLNKWIKIHESVKRVLEEKGAPLDEKELIRQCAAEGESQQDPKKLLSYLAVSKAIQSNVFGKWGLSSWSTIQPKGTREKAYLILESLQKPLHFREIAASIDAHGLQKNKYRKTHPQTVHNELIKDKRFVLIGRGTYALSQWGYKRGTVKEVLNDVLRNSETPLKRSEIIERVLKTRQVKKSTIVINLNTFFARVGKDMYTIKK